MEDQRDQCILFSLVFTRSPCSHHDSVWVLPVIFHCIAGAGLPNHMIVEVLWDPKRRPSWDASILLVADCSFKFLDTLFPFFHERERFGLDGGSSHYWNGYCEEGEVQ